MSSYVLPDLLQLFKSPQICKKNLVGIYITLQKLYYTYKAALKMYFYAKEFSDYFSSRCCSDASLILPICANQSKTDKEFWQTTLLQLTTEAYQIT